MLLAQQPALWGLPPSQGWAKEPLQGGFGSPGGWIWSVEALLFPYPQALIGGTPPPAQPVACGALKRRTIAGRGGRGAEEALRAPPPPGQSGTRTTAQPQGTGIKYIRCISSGLHEGDLAQRHTTQGGHGCLPRFDPGRPAFSRLGQRTRGESGRGADWCFKLNGPSQNASPPHLFFGSTKIFPAPGVANEKRLSTTDSGGPVISQDDPSLSRGRRLATPQTVWDTEGVFSLQAGWTGQ